MNKCIAFTGGGTGGHVFPALAVLAELEASHWDGRIIWIGSARGIERGLVHGRVAAYYGVPAGKLRRYLSLRNLFDLLRIGFGILASLAVLLKERPRMLFSKGGYVSVPPVLAARILGIPVFTHESDLNPGLATRINARFAEAVLVSFAESGEYLPEGIRPRVVHTGNPVRAALLAGDPALGRRHAGCTDGRPIVLVLGGSLGSRFVNGLVEGAVGVLSERCFVVHQMGRKDFAPSNRAGYFTAPFFDDELPHLLAAARLVVCRAGANTVWELAALGKPALLIPLSRAASRGDQIENARYLEDRGAATVLEESAASPSVLANAILGLLEDGPRLEGMGRAARELARPESSRTIAKMIIRRSESPRVRDAV